MKHKNDSFLQQCSSLLKKIKEQSILHRALSIPKPTSIDPSVIQLSSFIELDSVAIARLRTFSNWPHCSPSREVLAVSGWFYTNIDDRVICIYCNAMCHQWTSKDDPYDAHVRLSPKCPFILSRSTILQDAIPVITENPEGRYNIRYPSMNKILGRNHTFDDSWTLTSPSVTDLVEAGFFYSGTENTVTCFYCGGSLHQWSANDIPKIEHARWFSNCLYAKHLCGTNLYLTIQMKKKQLEIANNRVDEERLKRLVNARLDLPIVRHLCTTYEISIVKKCIEQQWRINNDDFASEQDLAMACFILKKMIDSWKHNANKLIVTTPSQISIDSAKKENKNSQECVVCLSVERQLACMPCGHLCACVTCGYGLTVCPLCRQRIQSFVRIYS